MFVGSFYGYIYLEREREREREKEREKKRKQRLLYENNYGPIIGTDLNNPSEQTALCVAVSAKIVADTPNSLVFVAIFSKTVF